MAFTKDAFVVFHNKPAIIKAVENDKYELTLTKGGVKSVRAKDIELLHPGPVNTLPSDEYTKPDFEEVLNLMEEETLSFGDFCEIAFNEYTPKSAWAAYQLLMEDIYFTGSPTNGIKAKSQTDIDAKLADIAKKENEKKLRSELLDRIRNGAILPSDSVSLREIEHVALGKAQSSKLLKDLEIEALPEKAHKLLLNIKHWDYFTNPWPSRMGVEEEYENASLTPLDIKEERVDLTYLTCYAIDDVGNKDPDDAISIDNDILWVHVADPASIVTPGSQFDESASKLGANCYLPEKVYTMLPKNAVSLFGLGLEETSPALSFAIKILEDGTAKLEKMCLSTIKVERTTYDDCDERIDQEPFVSIQNLLDKFIQKREANGAIELILPEVKIRVKDKEVFITPCNDTPARNLVANAMLAAGSAVANWAVENDIPMPFASQGEPEEIIEGDSLSSMIAQRKKMSPTVTCSTSSPHTSLGLDSYVRVTSPLRRYCDLLAHQQIRKYLKNEELLDSEYIDSRLTYSDAGVVTRRKTERYSNEYFTCVYLALHPEYETTGTVVDEVGDKTVIMIEELAYEYKTRYKGKMQPNEQVKLTLSGVDVAQNSSSFKVSLID
jgi:exoribonuclease-2